MHDVLMRMCFNATSSSKSDKIGYGDAGIPSFFLDESRFSLQRGDGRVRVYCRRNKCHADCCIIKLDRFGGGGSCSPLVVIDGNLNAQRHRYVILAHHVIPLFHNNANISIFQHDNATSHIARHYKFS